MLPCVRNINYVHTVTPKQDRTGTQVTLIEIDLSILEYRYLYHF